MAEETSSTTEDELNKILKSNKCKSVKINGKNYWIGKKVKEAGKYVSENQTTEGGFIPLLGLIPGIIAGITAAGGAASAIASTVSNSRAAQANELEKIKKQKEIEILERSELKNESVNKTDSNPNVGSGLSGVRSTSFYGNGIYLKPYQATAMHKYFKNNTDIPADVTKKFKDGIEIEMEVDGDDIYLKPYRA